MFCCPRDAGWRRRCFPLIEHPDITESSKESFAACEKITAGNNSNLFLAAKTLPKWRYQFFLASYAAMRVIDDLVDEEFLLKPAEEREQNRDGMIATIGQWQDQCLGQGAVGPLSVQVQSALGRTIQLSDLGPWPWTELASAMRQDSEEVDLKTWDDFLQYCSGATVAPAMIFIYLLGATRDKNGKIDWPHPSGARDYAEDLAIYCYIVHILRDMAKDAEKSIRLLTIPLEMLSHHGLDRADVSRALSNNDGRISGLVADLIARAEHHQKAGHERLSEISKLLGRREALALNGLIKIYDRLFQAFVSDYMTNRLNSDGLESAARAESFGE